MHAAPAGAGNEDHDRNEYEPQNVVPEIHRRPDGTPPGGLRQRGGFAPQNARTYRCREPPARSCRRSSNPLIRKKGCDTVTDREGASPRGCCRRSRARLAGRCRRDAPRRSCGLHRDHGEASNRKRGRTIRVGRANCAGPPGLNRGAFAGESASAPLASEVRIS
jgi:hypothetical protein